MDAKGQTKVHLQWGVINEITCLKIRAPKLQPNTIGRTLPRSNRTALVQKKGKKLHTQIRGAVKNLASGHRNKTVDSPVLQLTREKNKGKMKLTWGEQPKKNQK